MAFRLAYSTLRWQNPNLEEALAALKEAGWDGWEGRLPLDWLGTPSRLRRVCDNAGMPFCHIGVRRDQHFHYVFVMVEGLI